MSDDNNNLSTPQIMDNTSAANLTAPNLIGHSATVEAMDFKIVNSDAALVEMVDACLKQPAIALDSELIRTAHFSSHPSLSQLYLRHLAYLISYLVR